MWCATAGLTIGTGRGFGVEAPGVAEAGAATGLSVSAATVPGLLLAATPTRLVRQWFVLPLGMMLSVLLVLLSGMAVLDLAVLPGLTVRHHG